MASQDLDQAKLKKKLFAGVFLIHLLLICFLGVSFSFQEPEKKIKFVPLMNVSLTKLTEPVAAAAVEPIDLPKDPIVPPVQEKPKTAVVKDRVKDDAAKKRKADLKKKRDLQKAKDKKLAAKRLADKKAAKKKLDAKKKRDAKRLAEKKAKQKKLDAKRLADKKAAEKKLAAKRWLAKKAALARQAKAAAASASAEQGYLQELGQRLKLTWRQPSSGVQFGSYVVVRLTIERDGRISDSEIRNYKANSVMMASVKEFLKGLKRFKRFPSQITGSRITQDFKLEVR